MRLLSLILVLNLVSVSASAEPLLKSTNPDADKKITVDQLKKMQTEAEARMVNEEPKDAFHGIMAMNACMQKALGQQGMAKMEKQGRAFDAQVKALCKAGKIDEAKALQLKYAEEFSASSEFTAMKTCSEKYKAMLKEPMFDGIRRNMGRSEPNPEKICG